jgi:uncharacterized membrane protein YciS (DUF1049 family)
MSFKVILKLVVFLATLFVFLYIGAYNKQAADFNFPILLDKKLTTDAWEIYFGMFAVGVVAGAILMLGAGGGRGRSSPKSDK